MSTPAPDYSKKCGITAKAHVDPAFGVIGSIWFSGVEVYSADYPHDTTPEQAASYAVRDFAETLKAMMDKHDDIGVDHD